MGLPSTASAIRKREPNCEKGRKGVGHAVVRKIALWMQANYMAQDANNLVWLDMEMTGLDPDNDRVIELAMIVTDSNLDTLAESPVWVVHQPDAVLDAMDDWNQSTHGRPV